MTADVSQDRRVTATHPGWSTRFVDGSRLCWALPSPVHEGLWYRAFVPDRIQGDAVFPHASFTAQSRITCAVERDRSSRPSSFAPGSPSSRRGPGYDPIRRATTVPASLDDGCARRSAKSWPGRRNTLGRTKKLICPVVKGDRYDDCLLTSTAPYKDGLSLRNPSSPQDAIDGYRFRSTHPAHSIVTIARPVSCRPKPQETESRRRAPHRKLVRAEDDRRQC